MKRLSIATGLVLLYISMAWAPPCFYGDVMYAGHEKERAPFAYVYATKDGFCDTVQADANGHYSIDCFQGTYDMKAWKDAYFQYKFDQYNHGGPGDVRVSFQIGLTESWCLKILNLKSRIMKSLPLKP